MGIAFVLVAGCTTMFAFTQIWSHCRLIGNGYTTNETFNMLRYSYFRDRHGNVRNPFGNGWTKNWTIFCFERCNKKLRESKVIDIEQAPIVARAIQKKMGNEKKDNNQGLQLAVIQEEEKEIDDSDDEEVENKEEEVIEQDVDQLGVAQEIGDENV